jgi:hypothetical protein
MFSQRISINILQMTFDLQDIFTILPPEIVQRILLHYRTPTADVIQQHLLDISIQLHLEQAWAALELTSSDSDEDGGPT